MAGKLNALKVKALGPGMYLDDAGLYLVITPELTRSRIYRFSWKGRRPQMGLGAVSDGVGLAEARSRRDEARRVLQSGVNPIEARKQSKAAEQAKTTTFKQIADEVFTAKRKEWKNERHADQWRQSLDLASAAFGQTAIDQLDTETVLRTVKPVWTTAPETGRRLLQRIEAVLDAAKVKGLRAGENPAAWKGNLEHLLSRPKKGGHHAAMPYEEVPAFMAKLSEDRNTSAKALEFAILTAARTGEVTGATWSEIDLDRQLWTIPAKRMKAGGKEHRVPLCARAVEILKALHPVRISDYVFPGQKPKSPLCHIAMQTALDRLDVKDGTPHGFRSSFRDWCGDATEFPREIAEAALAHTLGSAVEAAYIQAQGRS